MIYVMSDIHGQKRRFDSVMKQINLQPEDTLYVLGDVIDRNPDGIKILRQIMAMSNAKMLLGNHELMMMNALYYPPPEDEEWPEYYYERKQSLWYRNGGEITHNYLKHIKKTVRQEIFEYLEKLPVNMEITVNGRQFILTHAAPPSCMRPTVVNMSVSETLPSGCDLTVSLFWRTVQSSSDTRQLSVSSMITQWQYGMQRAGSESTAAVCSLKRVTLGQEHLEDCRVSDWMICRSFTPRNLNTTILKNRRNSIMDDGKVTITIEIDAELLAQVTEVLKSYGLTPEEAAVQFFKYCADPKTQDHAIKLLKRWKEEQEVQERNSTNAK